MDIKSLFDFLVLDNVENINVVLASVLIAWDVVLELALVAESGATRLTIAVLGHDTATAADSAGALFPFTVGDAENGILDWHGGDDGGVDDWGVNDWGGLVDDVDRGGWDVVLGLATLVLDTGGEGAAATERLRQRWQE